MTIIVPRELAGLRLDQVLAKLLPEYSRSRLQDWITQGVVRVSGAAATPKQKVWGGEFIDVTPAAHPAEQPDRAENIALDVIYEDDSILVINKPAGLVVHPGSGNWEGTLLNALLHHAPQLAEVPRAGIVHRLDKDTSGLLVVAETLTAQTAPGAPATGTQRKSGGFALAYGEIKHDGRLTPHRSSSYAAHPDGGGRALEATPSRIIRRRATSRLHAAAPQAGNGWTHQIRVHLASILSIPWSATAPISGIRIKARRNCARDCPVSARGAACCLSGD